MKTHLLRSGVIKILLTLLLLFLILRSVDISRIGHDLGSFNGKTLALLLAIGWAGQMLCSERWRIFAASLQLRGTYLNFIRMYFAGMFFNIGLPSLVGGDLVKAYMLSRKNSMPLETGLASVLQDRAAGLVTLLAYGTVCMAIRPISWRGIPLWPLYPACWIGVAFMLWLALKGERFYGDKRLNGPAILQKGLDRIAGFHKALGSCRMNFGEVLRIISYSFIYSGLILLIFWQVAVAAGHEMSLVAFSALFPLITIGTMLPLTLGGLGIREWLYVEALSSIGIPRDQGLAISLATSAFYLVSNFAGIAFLPGARAELRPQASGPPEKAVPAGAAEDRIHRQNDVI